MQQTFDKEVSLLLRLTFWENWLIILEKRVRFPHKQFSFRNIISGCIREKVRTLPRDKENDGSILSGCP